jgi:hypothetical protein
MKLIGGKKHFTIINKHILMDFENNLVLDESLIVKEKLIKVDNEIEKKILQVVLNNNRRIR